MQPIIDYEDTYTICEDGTVTRQETGLRLTPSVNPDNGYLYVSLWKGNKGKTVAVHRLVAIHFIPNPLGKPNVNHKNSDRADPRKVNLEWCTQAENIQHGYDFGYMSQEARRNFTDFELHLLLDSFLSGVTLTDISKEVGCGLPRLSVNIRRLATEIGKLTEYTDELYRQKCLRNAAANEGRKQKVAMSDLEGNLIAVFESMTAAARALGKRSTGTISNALNPHHPQKKAYNRLWKLM